MAIFNRQTADQITMKMVDWIRGTTTQLTDFRVGSKNRAILEAVAVVLEDFYDKVFRAVKKAIQLNLYTAFGFAALPAVNSSGIIRLYAQNPPSADQPFYIPMGTQVQAAPTSSRGPVLFQTTKDAYIYAGGAQQWSATTINGVNVTGWYYVDVPAVCLTSGTVGNVGSNSIQTLVGAPSGIGAVTNPAAFANGSEAESLSAQKARFQLFMRSRARGTLESIEYGATTAVVMDPSSTFVQERVVSAIVIDGDGTHTVYVWNGVGTASLDLITSVRKVLDGYVDENGDRVWGYKGAGIPYSVFSVSVVNVPLSMTITPQDRYGVTNADSSAGLIDVRPYVTNAVSNYFASLKPGQTVVKSAIEAIVKQIPGVYDVQITAPVGNVTATQTQILVAQLPINFTKGTTV